MFITFLVFVVFVGRIEDEIYSEEINDYFSSDV